MTGDVRQNSDCADTAVNDDPRIRTSVVAPRDASGFVTI